MAIDITTNKEKADKLDKKMKFVEDNIRGIQVICDELKDELYDEEVLKENKLRIEVLKQVRDW